MDSVDIDNLSSAWHQVISFVFIVFDNKFHFTFMWDQLCEYLNTTNFASVIRVLG